MEIENLMKIAKAASPGPWRWERPYDDAKYFHLKSPHGRVLDDGSAAGEYGVEIEPKSGDGIYLETFNPQKVCELLEVVNALEDYINCKDVADANKAWDVMEQALTRLKNEKI